MFFKPVACGNKCTVFTRFRFPTVFSPFMITPDCCRKLDKPIKKSFPPLEFRESAQKEVSTSHYCKKICLHYVLLCSTMNLLCIIYASHYVHIVYYATTYPNCSILTALFPSFSFLLTLFLGFLYLYIVVFPLYITMMLRLCLSVQDCVFFRFFDVETSF